MTSPILAASPLITAPYLQLRRQSAPGDPGVVQYLYPKLAKAPKKIRATKSLDKMALISDLRVQDMPDALGNTSQAAPTSGLRRISWSDRFVLLGGDTTTGPKLYEKAGPFYLNTHHADFPAPSAYATAACFSQAGNFMFVTWSTSPGSVQVFTWSGSTPVDPLGAWVLGTPLTGLAGTVLDLWISPLNNFLVVQTSTKFYLFDLYAGLVEVTSSGQAGTLLAIKANELEWIYAANTTTDVKVATRTGSVFTQIDVLPSSAGSDLKAAYSPDQAVIAVVGRPQSGGQSPRFYCRSPVTGSFIYSRGITHTNTAAWDSGKILFRDDSQLAIATAGTAGSRAEFYTRDVVTPEPFVPDGTLGLFAPNTSTEIVRSNDGLVIASGLKVFRWDGSAYVDVTPASYSVAQRLSQSLSGDGSYLMTLLASKNGLPFHWDGTAYVAMTQLVTTNLQRGVALSPLGTLAALVETGTLPAATFRIMTLNVGAGTWSQVGSTIAFSAGSTIFRMEFCPGREDLVMVCSHLSTPLVFKVVSGTWTALGGLPFESGFTFGLTFAWHPTGAYVAALARNAAGNWKLFVFAKDSSDNFTLVYTSGVLYTSTGAIAMSLSYALDGNALAAGINGTAPPYFLWTVSGTAYTARTLPTPPSAIGTFAIFTLKHLVWSTTASASKWIYDYVGELQTYALDTALALTGTALAPMSYSYNGSVLHYGKSGDAHHVFSVPPHTALASLSFASNRPSSEVFDVLESHTGKTVLYQTPSGIFISTRANAGSDFLTSENLAGTFVELYDLVGSVYTERNYSVYTFGTLVYDITFSPNEEVVSYHVKPAIGSAPDAPAGRLLYDISGAPATQRFDFKGQVWETDLTDTYIAFSPFNTEFVVTHEHTSGASFISLHEFTTGYTWANQDTKLVPFGPVDFSNCDDVVVAHGGTPPLTFFKHDDAANLLVPVAKTITWSTDDKIQDIAFSPDCGKLAVLTPDTITVLEPDPDDDDKLDPDEPPTELDEPTDESDDGGDGDGHGDDGGIDWDDDDNINVDDNRDKPKPDYPSVHHYDPDDKQVYNISYVPYVVETITFRVYSVPE